MTVEQTVDIPPSRRISIDVPPEIPDGKVILSFSSASISKDIDRAREIWTANRNHPEELKAKLQNLQGSLGEDAFDGLDGIAYQRKIREEWDNNIITANG